MLPKTCLIFYNYESKQLFATKKYCNVVQIVVFCFYIFKLQVKCVILVINYSKV